jgi:hypothetical protein
LNRGICVLYLHFVKLVGLQSINAVVANSDRERLKERLAGESGRKA